jgi:hypothetical protein
LTILTNRAMSESSNFSTKGQNFIEKAKRTAKNQRARGVGKEATFTDENILGFIDSLMTNLLYNPILLIIS